MPEVISSALWQDLQAAAEALPIPGAAQTLPPPGLPLPG